MVLEFFPDQLLEKKGLFLINNHFCSIWKSHGISFNEIIAELETNFIMVDYFITEERFNCHFKYEFAPNENEPKLTCSIVYEFETHNTEKARP